MIHHIVLLPIAALIYIVSSKTVHYNWTVGWSLQAPDGFTRPVITVNKQWPPPVVEADLGDTVVVDVFNNLGNQTTSIHWHGLFQRGTNSMDGSSMVTQCPIPPGSHFRYRFLAEPAGTHWWHSQNRGQFPDGLRGIFVVRDRKQEVALGIAKEYMFTVSDWYHEQMPFLINWFLNSEGATMWTYTDGMPMSDASLINDTTTLVLDMEPGKKHLLRIVGACATFQHFITFEDHQMLIVGIDGVPTQPTPADTISVACGQRYDVILSGKRQPKRNYAFVSYQPDKHEEVVGELRYSDQFDRPGEWIWTEPPIDDMDIKPLNKESALLTVDREIVLPVYMTRQRRIFIGGHSYVAPLVPTLFTALSTGKLASNASVYGHGVNPVIVEYGDIVQIEVANSDPVPRPIHLHGHRFQVMARVYDFQNTQKLVFSKTPMVRDTVVVPPTGFVVLRFVANNPGVWLLHSQVELHTAAGMAVTIIESPKMLQAKQGIPTSHIDVCKSQGIPMVGNCAGITGEVRDSMKCRIFPDSKNEFGQVIQTSYENRH